jgi:hypothetical protein
MAGLSVSVIINQDGKTKKQTIKLIDLYLWNVFALIVFNR